MFKLLLYQVLKKSVGFCFNCLNICLFGNLPPLGCISVIVEDQGKFLLLKRPNGNLEFPGGFMRWREHPRQTALREFKEETGLQVTLHHVVACYSKTSKNFLSMSTLILVFCAEVNGGDLRGSVEGHPYWIEEADLLEMVDFRYGYMLNDYREHRKQHDRKEFCGAIVREMAEMSL
ncbi:MAG TPA: NUDIX hydrolase [Ktedonobacteraceae bacterium]|nr:NUDIX hydrolase [Ktedonobacteraceae bacterium]